MLRPQKTLQDQLDYETEKRIAQMEDTNYVFPPRFTRKDYLLWALVTVICLLMLILGARL